MPYKNKEKQKRAQLSWYWRHRKQVRAKAKICKLKQRNLLRQYVVDYLKQHPCIKCKQDDPIVLEFDHVNPATKYRSISDMVAGAYSLERLKKEMAKCQVMCANCHRSKTTKQFGYFRKK